MSPSIATRIQRVRLKRKVKIKTKKLKEKENVSPYVKKYRLQRYDLFSRYDEGIKMEPKDGHSLFQVAQAITPNIIMYLPRNIDVPQASELSWLSSPPSDTQVEENFVRGRSKGITAYFGNIASV